MARNEDLRHDPQVPKRRETGAVRKPETAVPAPLVTVPERRGSRTKATPSPANIRYRRIANSHLLEHPNVPLDNKGLLKVLGVTEGRVSQIRKSSRESGEVVPLSVSEEAKMLRRGAGIPKREPHRLPKVIQEQRRIRRAAIKIEREKLTMRIQDMRRQGLDLRAIEDSIYQNPPNIPLSDSTVRHIYENVGKPNKGRSTNSSSRAS